MAEKILQSRAWGRSVFIAYLLLLAGIVAFRWEYWPVTDYRFFSRLRRFDEIKSYAFVATRRDGSSRFEMRFFPWSNTAWQVRALIQTEGAFSEKARAVVDSALARCRSEFPACAFVEKTVIETPEGFRFQERSLGALP